MEAVLQCARRCGHVHGFAAIDPNVGRPGACVWVTIIIVPCGSVPVRGSILSSSVTLPRPCDLVNVPDHTQYSGRLAQISAGIRARLPLDVNRAVERSPARPDDARPGEGVTGSLERFGANLRRLRDEAGLTQMALSHRCQLEAAEISRLESGLRDPHLSTVLRLAAGLNVEPAELLRSLSGAR
jgi:hypothetical protein